MENFGYERILVPTDMSDFANQAIRYASLLRERLGSRITLHAPENNVTGTKKESSAAIVTAPRCIRSQWVKPATIGVSLIRGNCERNVAAMWLQAAIASRRSGENAVVVCSGMQIVAIAPRGSRASSISCALPL